MKKYTPVRMMQNSRFRNYIRTLPDMQYQETIRILERLISENSVYTDQKNHAHLCNLLTCLALVMMHETSGMTRKESQAVVSRAMYDFIQPQIRSMQRLSRHHWFVPMLKWMMPLKFRLTLGYGWRVTYPACGRHEFKMITHECIYAKIFSDYGMPEMAAVFCKVDDILYQNLPCMDFIYTQQIGTGGAVCDYTFRTVKTSRKSKISRTAGRSGKSGKFRRNQA